MSETQKHLSSGAKKGKKKEINGGFS